MNEFRQFDVVSDHSDHHFRDLSTASNITGHTKKSILKEWKILEQNLSESIYVRVYEQCIDLMRAAIIGPADTPYQDNIFFFDIAFPSDYPHSPPMVHFISKVLPLNQYLNKDGTVHLTLLNTYPIPLCFTFFNTNSEKWNPSASTCFQLLISIQTLVFTKLPAGGHGYGESVFIRICELTLSHLQRPPKNFEALVKGHFRDRAKVILSAFIEYATGRMIVGSYGYVPLLPMVHWIFVSDSYRKWAEKFYPLMLNEFELCGASLDTFDRSLVLSKRTTILMGLIKKAFTWKKKRNNDKED
ncbi:probable ubiquitin-conjugating enzyme E2 24 [Lotus japonicus]|uniref:probable ubiquitin-conjugating enzyme E2 24 n=1 Tax=Lotus japonicus TaxID=34305 RepID=UPI002583D506|nr:probable ubiquitin-conjugating enzyme E2 24 [Lotus japonicus]